MCEIQYNSYGYNITVMYREMINLIFLYIQNIFHEKNFYNFL